MIERDPLAPGAPAREYLRGLLAAAYLEGLRNRPDIAPADPATIVRLDDTGRAPVVPLRDDRA